MFGERIIEDQEPELSTSFYAEQNPADQAPPHLFQPFSLEEFQTSSPIEPTPFSGDRMKVKAFLQECLVYIDMNEEVYTTDKLKIGFVLSYMDEKEAKDW